MNGIILMGNKEEIPKHADHQFRLIVKLWKTVEAFGSFLECQFHWSARKGKPLKARVKDNRKSALPKPNVTQYKLAKVSTSETEDHAILPNCDQHCWLKSLRLWVIEKLDKLWSTTSLQRGVNEVSCV